VSFSQFHPLRLLLKLRLALDISSKNSQSSEIQEESFPLNFLIIWARERWRKDKRVEGQKWARLGLPIFEPSPYFGFAARKHRRPSSIKAIFFRCEAI